MVEGVDASLAAGGARVELATAVLSLA
jgi:hypothetical protein